MDQCWAPGLPIVCCNDGLTGRRSSLLHPQRGICRSYAHSCDPDVPGSLCNIWWCLSTLAGAICHFLLPKWKKLFLVDNLFIENSVPWIGTIKNHLPVGTGFFWRSWGRSSSEELVWLMSRSVADLIKLLTGLFCPQTCSHLSTIQWLIIIPYWNFIKNMVNNGS